jgi:hypothetical protein
VDEFLALTAQAGLELKSIGQTVAHRENLITVED